MTTSSKSEEESKIDFYTKSFSILYDVLKQEPEGFPWREVLSRSRTMLKDVLAAAERAKGTYATSSTENEAVIEQFAKALSEKLDISEDRARELVDSYITSEKPDDIEFNDRRLRLIMDFYFNERRRAASILKLYFIFLVESDTNDERNSAVEETVNWLLDNNLEETVYKQFLDLCNFKLDPSKFESETYSLKQSTNLQIYIMEQKLAEKAELLELMFMIYYQKVKCSPARILELLSIFVENDFMNDDKSYSAQLSARALQIINRNVAVSVLLLMCILHLDELIEGELEFTGQQVGRGNDFVSRLNGHQLHHGAVFLIWAICLKNIRISELQQRSHEYLYRGKNHGVQYLLTIFDKEGSSYYPFQGHDELFEAYRDVGRGAITGILSFESNDLPEIHYPYLQQIITLTELLVSPTCNKLSGECNFVSVSAFYETYIQFSPYSNLYDFMKEAFPARSDLLRLLSLVIYDTDSAAFALEYLDRQNNYCILDIANSYRNNFIGNSNRIQENFRDEKNNYIIQAGREVIIHELESTPDCSYIFVNQQVSGLELVVRQLLTVIARKSTNNPNAICSCLSFLYKLAMYGSVQHLQRVSEVIMQIEQKEYAEPHLFLVHNIIKTLVYEPKNLSIVILCCQCLHAFSKSSPIMVGQIINSMAKTGIIAVISKIETALGRYSCLLSLLDAILVLATIHPAPLTSINELIPLLCSSVFAEHDTWRYQRLEQRWLISCKCLAIFNRIIKDSFWKKSQIQHAGVILMRAFFTDSSLYRILFSLLGAGGSFLETIIRTERTDQSLAVLEVIDQCLLLMESLLKYRLSPQSQAAEKTTPFEDTLLSLLIGRKQVPIITAIFELILNDHSPQVRIVACRVINLVAQLTEQYHPRPPSLVSYLGSQSNQLVGSCIKSLRSYESSTELKIELFNLIATTVDLQRGLAEDFLHLEVDTIAASDSKEPEQRTLPKDGCVATILSVVHRGVSLISAGETKLLCSALSVLVGIFQKGEHRSITEQLTNDPDFWADLRALCNFVVKPASKELRDDVYLTRSATYILTIMAIDLYQNTILQTQEEAAEIKKDLKKPFASQEGSDNEKDDELLDRFLQMSIGYITDGINDDGPLVADLDEALKHVASYMDYVITNAITDTTDALYDVKRLRRWEPTAEDTQLLLITERLNHRFTATEAYLSLFDAMYRIIAVKRNAPPSPHCLDIILNGLQVDTAPYSSEIGIRLPLPKLLENLMGTLHRHVAKMVVAVVRRMDPADITIEQMQKLERALRFQVDRQNTEIVEELLTCWLLILTKTQDEKAIEIRVEERAKLSPTLIRAMKTFGANSNSSRLCISILSLFGDIRFTEEEYAFICRSLAQEISNTKFETDAKQTDKNISGSSTHIYTQDILSLLLAMALSETGSTALVTYEVVQRLTNNSSLSASTAMYQDGDRTASHNCWRLTLKIMCSLLNNYRSPIERAQIGFHDRNNYELRYTGKSQLLLQQCIDFCAAHQQRLIFALVDIWTATNPLTLAALEEAELTSMFINGLARVGLLEQMPVLVEATKWGLSACANTIKNSHLTLRVIQPISNKEKRILEKQMNKKEDVPLLHQNDGREALSWNTQINLTVYGALRCLLATIRCLTGEIGSNSRDGFQNLKPILVLEDMNAPSLEKLLEIIHSCADTIEIVSSRKFKGSIITMTRERSSSNASVASSPSSASSVSGLSAFSSAADSDSRLLLAKMVVRALREVLHVSITHLVLYLSHLKKHQQYHDARSEDTYSREEKNLLQYQRLLVVEIERAIGFTKGIETTDNTHLRENIYPDLEPVVDLMKDILSFLSPEQQQRKTSAR